VKPLLVLAVLGLMAAAFFGVGKVLGAWDAPEAAPPSSATTAGEEPTASVEQPEPDADASSPGGRKRTGLPVSVVRKVDALCRRASADALAIAAKGRPTTKQGVRRLFGALDELNETYNRAALRALSGQAKDRRVRTLARLFDRDERLLDDLVATIAVLETPAGQARFEQGLAELQRVGKREERVLAKLGVRSCDTSFVN
jgi:hypothetical protein